MINIWKPQKTLEQFTILITYVTQADAVTYVKVLCCSQIF